MLQHYKTTNVAMNGHIKLKLLFFLFHLHEITHFPQKLQLCLGVL